MSNADRILYNADKSILFWGNFEYQKCVDFTTLAESCGLSKIDDIMNAARRSSRMPFRENESEIGMRRTCKKAKRRPKCLRG